MKLCPRELLEVTQSGHTALHVCLFASCPNDCGVIFKTVSAVAENKHHKRWQKEREGVSERERKKEREREKREEIDR